MVNRRMGAEVDYVVKGVDQESGLAAASRLEAMAIKREFLKQVRESGDHCPCKQACPHHGNCFECVTLHRGHRDHLPMCMWDMVNERLHKLSRLTEGTLRSYEEAHR